MGCQWNSTRPVFVFLIKMDRLCWKAHGPFFLLSTMWTWCQRCSSHNHSIMIKGEIITMKPDNLMTQVLEDLLIPWLCQNWSAITEPPILCKINYNLFKLHFIRISDVRCYGCSSTNNLLVTPTVQHFKVSF